MIAALDCLCHMTVMTIGARASDGSRVLLRGGGAATTLAWRQRGSVGHGSRTGGIMMAVVARCVMQVCVLVAIAWRHWCL